MQGLETVYKAHHERRGDGFAILMKERGAFLRKHVGTGKVVLDIGCRDGQLTGEYASGNTVTGADIDSDALARAAKNVGIATIHTDLNADWTFAPEAYDVVVACEVLEHIYFPDVIFKKVHAVLKPGGLFVGTIPHAYSIQSRIKFLLGTKRGTPLEDPTHINHFKYSDFKLLLEKDYEIIEIATYVPPRYQLLAKLFPYAFAHDLMFSAQKR